jgi:hypothetical protein
MTTISDKAAKALHGAIAHKGKNKGRLLVKAPPMQSLENAAWQAAQVIANPYKVSFMALIFMNDEQRAIYDELLAAFKGIPSLVKYLDRDRVALETIGVW